MSNNNSSTINSKLALRDRRIISRLIHAGYNSPISARLLNKNFKLIDENLINRLQITGKLNDISTCIFSNVLFI